MKVECLSIFAEGKRNADAKQHYKSLAGKLLEGLHIIMLHDGLPKQPIAKISYL